MTEERISIRSRGCELEGLLAEMPGAKGVVVTHPHPLYGGDMNNNVVDVIAGAYREKGYTTLRFNFRGVGRSGGTYGEGLGEQDDVAAVISFMGSIGITELDLAGYSFGVWINSMGIDRFSAARRLVMVSPPVNFMDFSSLRYNQRIEMIVSGQDDEIAPPHMIKELIPVWNPCARFDVIQGADHFFLGKTDQLERSIIDFLDQ